MAEFTLREATRADEDPLWMMLFYASHSNDEDGTTPDDVRRDPYLMRYVTGWGREGDAGVIAESGGEVVGAAWVRLRIGEERNDISFVDVDTPELAVAVLLARKAMASGLPS